jgi:hypothetical protein
VCDHAAVVDQRRPAAGAAEKLPDGVPLQDIIGQETQAITGASPGGGSGG